MGPIDIILLALIAGVSAWTILRLLRFVGAAVVVALSGIGDSER